MHSMSKHEPMISIQEKAGQETKLPLLFSAIGEWTASPRRLLQYAFEVKTTPP